MGLVSFHPLGEMAFLLYESTKANDHGASYETGEVYFHLVYPAIFTKIYSAVPISKL